MARRRRHAALTIVAAVLLVLASAVAVARKSGGTKPIVHAAAQAPVGVVTDATPTTPATTTTTVVLVQPPIERPPAALVSRPTTPSTVRPTPPTTAAVAAPASTAAPQPSATLAEVSPPNRDPRRTYVAARGQDRDAYVRHMSIDWGDGTPVANFDYPLSSCQTGILQAANADHAYAVPGTYTVRLIVTSVGCDGTGGGTAAVETPVTYSSSPAC